MEKRSRRLEVLLYVLGIAVCAAIMFPVFAQTRIISKGVPIGYSNVKACTTALLMYAEDYDDLIPYVSTQKALILAAHEYLKKDDWWQTCNPTHPGFFHLNPSLAGVALTDVQSPEQTPLLYDIFSQKPPFGYQGEGPIVNLSYAGGRSQMISEKVWQSTQPFLYLELKRHGLPLDR